MNKQDTLRNLLVAAAVFLVVLAVGPALLPTPPPRPVPSQLAVEPQAPLGPSSEPPEAVPSAAPAGDPAVATPSVWSVAQASQQQTIEIGAALDHITTHDFRAEPYRMRLALSNVGAGVESAWLTDHAAHVGKPDRYPLLNARARANGQVYRSLTVDKINVDGGDLVLSDKLWHTDGVKEYKSALDEGQSVTFQIDILKTDQPALRLSRTWRLPRQPEAVGRHDLHSEITITNLSDEPRRVVVTTRGGLGVSQDRDTDDRVVDTGVQSAPGRIAVTRKHHSDAFHAERPVPLFALNPSQPEERLVWAATGNTYFTCTVAPLAPDLKSAAPYVAESALLDADGDLATRDDATFRLVTSMTTVPPGGAVSLPSALFVGEKDARAFRNMPDYRDRSYYPQISQGFGMCTFSWLVELMIALLNGLFFVVRDFGVAIIILVLMVRALLHPLTKKGQVNMVKMQRKMTDLAPKIEEIKKKFANDKARMNQEMMKLNLNPAGQLLTCLPMFIQLPIWAALFLSLSNNILMRHEPLHLTWIGDLTAPDALYTFSAPWIIPLLGWRIASFNLLPILVSLFMYLQQKTQPKPPTSPNMTAEQRQQQEMMQKMMPLMSIMMLFIFYNMPAGLNLYIMFSSLFGWLEQLVIRKHIKQQEADGTLFAPKKTGGPGEGSGGEPGKSSWFERLQKMAVDAQKAQHSQRARSRR